MVVNISSVIKDLSKDVMHPLELSDRDHADRLRHQDLSRILLTHQIVTILINFVIRDLSRILLSYQFVTMPINFVIRDLSHILLTHQIVTILINFVIRDLSYILINHQFGRSTG